MEKKVHIKIGGIELEALLDNSNTAEAIWEALPITAQVNTWGEEIYFPIEVHKEPENEQGLVEKGDLGYWPVGNAFCIFFGPTPISLGEEIRPASAVNVFGKAIGNTDVLKRAKAGEEIVITRT